MDFPIPNEIITEILSYLGKNDLLKCRLVSHSWNELTLTILRNPKYEHEHELTQDNIQKFIEFSNGRDEKWVLPFHFNFRRDKQEESVVYHYIPNYIQQLQSIFGEKCVVGLTLSHKSTSLEPVKELISILTLIAPSITHLDLSEFSLTYHGEEEEMKAKEMLGNTQLNFPNLSKLKSCPAPPVVEGNLTVYAEQYNEIYFFLIKNSQNLKDLEVISPLGLAEIEQVGNLRKLKVVEKLNCLISIPQSIRICPTPVLKDLYLFCSARLSVLDHQVVYDFLASFSTSLNSLTIKFDEAPTNPFPILSQLRFLRIQVSRSHYSEDEIWVNPEDLNLNSDAFPVLESIDISANVCFDSTDAESGTGSSKDEWNLRTVKNLTIRMTNSSFNTNVWDMDQEDEEIISRPSARGYVDQLQELFPNVTSLTLVNESDEREPDLSELLTAFIQSDGAPKIQELEIQNYEKNYLGHNLNGLNPDREPRVIIENVRLDKEFLNSIRNALQGFSGGGDLRVDRQIETRDGVENSVITCKAPIMHLKMTGLEKIRLSLDLKHKSRQSGSEYESNQKDLLLMSLPNHLPLLRQIDISQQMFGDDKEFCKQQIVSVQQAFPDLIINTTR